jgi:hypothetical protein
MAQKWEYKTFAVHHDPGDEALGDWLTQQHGQYCWELISTLPIPSSAGKVGVLLIFKRPMPREVGAGFVNVPGLT